jgi:hypothetical protein
MRTLLRKLIDSSNAPCRLRRGVARRAEQRDEERVRRVAHKLRGLVSTFSPSIAATVAALEEPALAQHRGARGSQCDEIGESIAALV